MRANIESQESAWDEIATAFLGDSRSAVPHQLVASSRSEACLQVQAGGPIGKTVAIGQGLTVGRSASADLCIPDEGVSRIHLRVEGDPDGSARIIDQGSRNGTFVNFCRVDSALLDDGDRIYIGTRAILRFSHLDPLEEDFQQRMYEAALRDPLTGLFNRRHLMSQLESELNIVRRHASPLTLVLMDIDHFKTINDHYGHPTGDAVLRALAGHLKSAIRRSDFAARYGGEELAVVCRGVGKESGMRLARRLQQELQGRVLVLGAPDLRISFSAGVASAPHPLVRDAEGLLQIADAALYRAKNSGRNCVCASQ